MKNLHIDRMAKRELQKYNHLHPDVIFAIPSGHEVRGVGIDPRDGLFLILKTDRNKIFPLMSSRDDRDISSLTMIAVEVDSEDEINFIEEDRNCHNMNPEASATGNGAAGLFEAVTASQDHC